MHCQSKNRAYTDRKSLNKNGDNVSVFAKEAGDTCPRLFWRRHPELNTGIGALQALALTLGYAAIQHAKF